MLHELLNNKKYEIQKKKKKETIISSQRMSDINCDAYQLVDGINPGLMMIFATICS